MQWCSCSGPTNCCRRICLHNARDVSIPRLNKMVAPPRPSPWPILACVRMMVWHDTRAKANVFPNVRVAVQLPGRNGRNGRQGVRSCSKHQARRFLHIAPLGQSASEGTRSLSATQGWFSLTSWAFRLSLPSSLSRLQQRVCVRHKSRCCRTLPPAVQSAHPTAGAISIPANALVAKIVGRQSKKRPTVTGILKSQASIGN